MEKQQPRIQFYDYSMPNPLLAYKAYETIYRETWYKSGPKQETVEVARTDIINLLMAADAYLHFTTHPCDTTIQLSDVRKKFKELRRREWAN